MTAGVCALAAVYFGVHYRDAVRLRSANELGHAGRYDEALQKAEAISHVPEAGRALLVQAYALVALHRDRDASTAFAAAARRDPDNWRVHRDWSLVLDRLGAHRRAVAERARAKSLNPRLLGPPFTGGPQATALG
jgi:Flp pilus assembly protein TadD